MKIYKILEGRLLILFALFIRSPLCETIFLRRVLPGSYNLFNKQLLASFGRKLLHNWVWPKPRKRIKEFAVVQKTSVHLHKINTYIYIGHFRKTEFFSFLVLFRGFLRTEYIFEWHKINKLKRNLFSLFLI